MTAQIDAVVGAPVRVGRGGEEEIVGMVAELDPPSTDDRSARLRVAYVHEGREMGGEEWLLEHDGAMTQVRLIHSMPDEGVEGWDAFYDDMRRGWALFLASLSFAAGEAVLPDRTALPAPCRYQVAGPRTPSRRRSAPRRPEIEHQLAGLAIDLDGQGDGGGR